MDTRSDRELADAVVALGIGKSNQIYPDALGKFYQVDPAADWQTSVNESYFVRDWRVAGALMEKMSEKFIEILLTRGFHTQNPEVWIEDLNVRSENESLPRAIIEACVKALQETDDE